MNAEIYKNDVEKCNNSRRLLDVSEALPETRPDELQLSFAPVMPERVWLSKRQGQFTHTLTSFHDRFVLFIPLIGGSKVLLDRRFLALLPNHGLLIFPHQFHNLARSTNEDIMWIIITFHLSEYKQIERLRDTPVRLSDEMLAWLGWIIESACRSRRNNNQADRSICLLTMLLSEMLFRAKSKRKKASAALWNTAGQKLVSEAAVFISKNIRQPLTLEELAECLGVSVSLIQKHFRSAIGTSAGNYIRTARVLHSSNLLRNSNKTVSEIAAEYHFNDPYSYSKTFKSVMGVSPQVYRGQSVPPGQKTR